MVVGSYGGEMAEMLEVGDAGGFLLSILVLVIFVVHIPPLILCSSVRLAIIFLVLW